jgi:hypothetical protein
MAYPQLDRFDPCTPHDQLNQVFDWSQWLDESDSETIVSATVTPDINSLNIAGVVISLDGTQVGFVSSGGVPDTLYTITCQVTTELQETAARSATMIVKAVV